VRCSHFTNQVDSTRAPAWRDYRSYLRERKVTGWIKSDELRTCNDVIKEFPGLVLNALNGDTPTPPTFTDSWSVFRGALDRAPDLGLVARVIGTIAGSSCNVSSPKYVGYVPNASFPLARTVDAFLSMSNVVAAARIDGFSFVQAEAAAADKIADLAGYPSSTRAGTFLSGGTFGNFCALATARERWRLRHRNRSIYSPIVLASTAAHASVKVATRLLDMNFVPIDIDSQGRIEISDLKAKSALHRDSIAAIVGNAGTTTCGAIDDLEELAGVSRKYQSWLHVDGAYGGAVLLSATFRGLLDGINQSDSFVIDPHKWIGCPYESSLLVFRDADEVHKRLRHFVQSDEEDSDYLHFGFRHRPDAYLTDHTPSQYPLEQGDLALQLSRRPKGFVLWALLAGTGIDELGRRIESTMSVARELYDYAITKGIEVPVEPQLSVLLLGSRIWLAEKQWDDNWVLPAFNAGFFVSTDRWSGKPVGRLCIVNPESTTSILKPLLDRIGGP